MLLVNKDHDNQSPVVVQVPPPNQDLANQCTEAAAQAAAENQNPIQSTKYKQNKVSIFSAIWFVNEFQHFTYYRTFEKYNDYLVAVT